MSMLRRIMPSIALSLLVIAPAVSAQQSSFTVGTATAAPGQKVNGYIEVPAGVDAGTRIPVVVVRGAKPGPVLAIVSGSHGTEYASIIAVERLISELDPAQISGTVILIPLVNILSFEQKVPHVNPLDNKSMNRFYPGKMDGTQTDRVSFLITKQVVEPCDFLIDLHGGDLDENLRPYSYWTVGGNDKVDRVSREMTLAFGLNHIIIQSDFPRDPAASRYLSNTALTRNKPTVTAEAGYSGTVEPGDVDALVYGNLNVMRYLKMLPGAAIRRAPRMDRKSRHRFQRPTWHLLSTRQSRHLCLRRNENRLRHRLFRPHCPGSARACCRRRPVCLWRSLHDQRRRHRQHRSCRLKRALIRLLHARLPPHSACDGQS